MTPSPWAMPILIGFTIWTSVLLSGRFDDLDVTYIRMFATFTFFLFSDTCKVTPIEWNENKNPCFKLVKRKQKKAKGGAGRFVTKQVSFCLIFFVQLIIL